MIAVLVAAAAVATAPVGATEPGWIEFSRTTVLLPAQVRVAVGTLDYDMVGHRLDYWLRKTDQGLLGSDIMWTDSRRCPQARDVLGAMRHLGDTGPAGARPMAFLPEMTTYTLDTMSRSDRLPLMTSGSGAPLASWVDTALETLTPCWSDIPPVREKP